MKNAKNDTNLYDTSKKIDQRLTKNLSKIGEKFTKIAKNRPKMMKNWPKIDQFFHFFTTIGRFVYDIEVNKMGFWQALGTVL